MFFLTFILQLQLAQILEMDYRPEDEKIAAETEKRSTAD